ncbi:MAG: hypothetical protein KKB78_04005, partial [Alphaproteobacteria bacterium]|nr:hypothetical protein [Alphaproteobacteria bacterium]
PAGAAAQEGEKFDCAVSAVAADTKASIGAAMAGAGDDAGREELFGSLAAITKGCATQHAMDDAQQRDYFEYSLARIAREWLAGDIARLKLSTETVDKALDFGPSGANPDLSGDMNEDQIMTIVQAYIDSGVDIETVDTEAWEKVGAYAAATSIYWNKRKQLPF